MGASHVAAQLRLDGDTLNAVGREDLFVGQAHPFANGGDVRGWLFGTVGDAHAAGKVDEGQGQAHLVHEPASGIKEQLRQGGIIGIVDGVAGQERMQPEGLHAQLLQPGQPLLQLGIGEAVLGVPGIAHDGIADGEIIYYSPVYFYI